MKKLWLFVKTSFILKFSIFVTLASTVTLIYFGRYWQLKMETSAKELIDSALQTRLESQLGQVSQSLEDLKNQDQYVINQELTEQIGQIEAAYGQTVKAYEDLLDLKSSLRKAEDVEGLFAKTLSFLAQGNYASASGELKKLNSAILQEKEKLATASIVLPPSALVINQPPASSVGHQRQAVSTDQGNFLVDIISADLNSVRVAVDTASASDCFNDCPVLSLADYVARNGAFAGVNGTYFCPASYPSCAGKTNTFDLLVMNKNKYYFNSDNNVYSNNPAVIFSNGSARFVTTASQWGRDTSVDAVISNFPLLVFNNNIAFDGDTDAKQLARGNRSFVANIGSTVYIGVVHNATVVQSAKVLETMGMNNALNLDNGGSTALWYSGYKVGPGRNLPNAVLLIRK
ncbi:MAG: phosphodiester glycosidase family protein [Candidatus Shapirobacteria bacterium]